jgi:hypothetical protein
MKSKHASCATHAALDFIKNKQGAYFGATRTQRMHEGGRRPPHPGIALNGLDDHAGCSGRNLIQRSAIIMRQKADIW